MTMRDPVMIPGTGRCGPTAVSELLNRPPGVPSPSEVFVPLRAKAFAWPRPGGARMRRSFSGQGAGRGRA